MAVSPRGNRVFVTGNSYGGDSTSYDYATVAYNAATGAQLWVKRYNGPGNSTDWAESMAVSPSGSTVFVAGFSTGATSGGDYTTIAYSAATGARQWVKRYSSAGNRFDNALAVAASPTGGKVFVTGFSTASNSYSDYVTIAYSAATGTQMWLQRYNGPGNSDDTARSVAVNPSGSTLFVTGNSTGTTADWDYATVAYNTATGARLWLQRYNGPANGPDLAEAVVVGPSGGRVFVTGFSSGAHDDYATIAYKG